MIGTWAKRLALILGGVIASVLLAELALRLFAPQSTYSHLRSQWPAIHRESDILPYELIPNRKSRIVDPHGEFDTAVTINSLGYRGREFSKDKGGRKRVLVLGDSFTFGWGVEDDETYSVHLERELREKLGDEVEVINAGFASGFYPDAYYLYLKAKGLDLDPDLVVVGFYIGNDIIDFNIRARTLWHGERNGLPTCLAFTDTHIEDGYLVKNQPRKRYQKPVLRDSHLYQALYAIGNPLPDVNSKGTFNKMVFRKRYDQDTRNHLLLVQYVFESMGTLASSRNVPLLIAMFPAREQVHPPTGHAFVAAEHDLNKPNRLMRGHFTKVGLAYEDLLGAFRRASKTHRYYFTGDNHWNRDGHALAARRLAERIVQLGVLSK